MGASITPEQCKAAYQLGRKVFSKEMRITDAKEQLRQLGVNPNSAADLVSNLRHLLKGERYTRTLSASVTHDYLTWIRRDYGDAYLRNAISSVGHHIQYYSELTHAPLRSLRMTVQKHAALLKDERGSFAAPEKTLSLPVLHNGLQRDAYEIFRAWRKRHPRALVLCVNGKRALWHMSSCPHFGDPDANSEEWERSLTKRPKVLGRSIADLRIWASQHDIPNPRGCADCMKGAPEEADLEEVFRLLEGALPAAPQEKRVERAIEGIMYEGRVLRRSRNRGLRREALRLAAGVCAACALDYSKILGGLAESVLQVHHRKQLAADRVPRETTIADLAVVCANCHVIIHADPDAAISVESLRERWRKEYQGKGAPISQI